MHYSAYINCQKFVEKHINNLQGKLVLDVGSYDVNGTLKPIFQGANYVGLDMEEGPNVDVVSDAHNIPFEDEKFDIVTSSSCFEHDDMFWVTFLEICRVVKSGGYIYIQAPQNGPYHGWPGDNWRFYADSWKALEKWGLKMGYDIELVESYIDETTPPAESEGMRIWNDSVGIFRKRKVKKVALISSYCDTEEKLNVLEKNLKKIKDLNIDTILISPFGLPENILELCNYFFKTKDNIILDWPVKSMYHWRRLFFDNQEFELGITCPDYGFAGLTQIKQLSEIAINLGYEQFFHMIYDLKIDENVINGFLSNRKCNVYPTKKGNTVWNEGLHFMIFDCENLKKFISKITLENYLQAKSLDSFQWLQSIKEDINYSNQEIPVEDEIYYYENVNFFNHSEIEGLTFFIVKNDKTNDSIKLFFYNLPNQKNIKISIDDNEIEYFLESSTLIDLNFNKHETKNVIIKFDEKEQNLTKKIKTVKHSLITFL